LLPRSGLERSDFVPWRKAAVRRWLAGGLSEVDLQCT
jgi:hypothetical protein